MIHQQAAQIFLVNEARHLPGHTGSAVLCVQLAGGSGDAI